MMLEADGLYLTQLLSDSEQYTQILNESQDMAFKDEYVAYHQWANRLSYDTYPDVVMLCAVTALAKHKIFDPFPHGLKVSDDVMQNLSAICYRYDRGPHRLASNLVPYTSVDAINAIKVLELTRLGQLKDARQVAHSVCFGNVQGSPAQTLFVIQNLAMVVAFNESGAKPAITEMRATSLRLMVIHIREYIKRIPWCVDCTAHAHELFASTDDRTEAAREAEGSTTDSAWIQMMKREWGKQ